MRNVLGYGWRRYLNRIKMDVMLCLWEVSGGACRGLSGVVLPSQSRIGCHNWDWDYHRHVLGHVGQIRQRHRRRGVKILSLTREGGWNRMQRQGHREEKTRGELWKILVELGEIP